MKSDGSTKGTVKHLRSLSYRKIKDSDRQSWKLCQNLCSLRWLRPNLRRVRVRVRVSTPQNRAEYVFSLNRIFRYKCRTFGKYGSDKTHILAYCRSIRSVFFLKTRYNKKVCSVITFRNKSPFLSLSCSIYFCWKYDGKVATYQDKFLAILHLLFPQKHGNAFLANT